MPDDKILSEKKNYIGLPRYAPYGFSGRKYVLSDRPVSEQDLAWTIKWFLNPNISQN